jgi:Uncharacterised nucleotidyltransferase
VKQSRAEAIVAFLRFSGEQDRGTTFKAFTGRDWQQVIRWMDDAGLALYFLEKLKDAKATGVIPSSILSRLEENFASNQKRTAAMSERFNSLNRQFTNAGVRYAVVKGFSLVPQFCQRASLRHQSDFDYLVTPQSLQPAREILLKAGYVAKESRSCEESIFISAGAEAPFQDARQYSAHAPHAVELHVDMWDSQLHRLPQLRGLFSPERVRTQQWNDFTFPALDEADAFLLQIVHASHHLFTQWIRMSCLLEIGFFLNSRASDRAFWNQVEKRVGDNLVLCEFVVIVTELAAGLFGAPVPEAVGIWAREVRIGSRVWMENYARHWVFSDVPVYRFNMFPKSKFALFLLDQYRVQASPRNVSTRASMPPSRLSRMRASIRRNPSLILKTGWWKRQLLVRRSIFHALAGLRYLCEIPRWRRLNRLSAGSADM